MKDPLKRQRSNARFRENNRLKANDYWQRHAYGISLGQKLEMYTKQGGLCACCSEALPANFQKAHTDHDHVTGIVRSLLCRRCNLTLGTEEKFPGRLAQVLAYATNWLRD